jgi:hypothetical protein
MLNTLNLYEQALVSNKNSLAKSLSFNEKNFLQLFKDKLKDNLSESGKVIYDSADFKQSLKNTYKKFSDALTTEYLNLLDLAEKDASKTFDPHPTVKEAQAFLQTKLNELKTLLYNNLNDELIAKGQNFDEEDKEELNKVLNNYKDDCEKKLNTLLQQIEGIWSKVAKFQLHLSNEESVLKAKNPDATFAIKETDLDKLSIGTAPAPVTGFRVHKNNLAEQLMHSLANKKPREKINIELTVPDRNTILSQLGDIGLQHRNPAVALFFVLFFYFYAIVFNNDEKRAVTAVKNVIEKKGILINPNELTLTIKRLSNNGKSIVIREKAPLSPEYINDLQQSIQKLKEELIKAQSQKAILKSGNESDAGYGSGSDDQVEEVRRPRP